VVGLSNCQDFQMKFPSSFTSVGCCRRMILGTRPLVYSCNGLSTVFQRSDHFVSRRTSSYGNTIFPAKLDSLLFTSQYLTLLNSRPSLRTSSISRRHFLMQRLSTAAQPPLPEGAEIVAPTVIQPSIVKSGDGREFAAFEMPKFQRKLKPYIVKRRLNRMRVYIGKQKNIRHSPWRMNLVCQFAAGQTLTEAIKQLEFCKKSMAPLVQKVLIRTSNVADMKDGLQHSQLEVAECFATKGKPLKRIMIMGRGRSGRMEHKFSHFRVVLREIDFKLRIYQAETLNQKKRWFLRQQQAEADYAKAKAERDEITRLEKETEAYRSKDSK
jgi:ribosomal protein L22